MAEIIIGSIGFSEHEEIVNRRRGRGLPGCGARSVGQIINGVVGRRAKCKVGAEAEKDWIINEGEGESSSSQTN